MVMAEENKRAAIRRQDKTANLKILGQVLSFTLGLLGFVLAAVFGLNGAETGAIASLLVGISPVIVAALANLKKQPSLTGFDTHGNLIEVMYNDLGENRVNVFHAMPCRDTLLKLLEQGETYD